MTTPDKFIQVSLKRFAKEFVPRRDCSGEFSHRENCQGCIDVVVEEKSKLKSFLTQELKKAYRRGFKQGFKQGKGWQMADELERKIIDA